jgi:hypothetical protein
MSYFLMHGKEFRVLFSSAEWFGTEFRDVHLQYFGSTERNFEMYYLPQKGSEQNYGILLLFLFHGTEFRVIFSSEKGSERNSEIFCSAEQPEFRRK